MQLRWILLAGGLAVTAGTISAQIASNEAPVVAAVLECQRSTESSQRLACYDRTVAAFELALKRDEIKVADRATVREAKRGLFGFSLKDINLFKEKGGEEPVEAIDAKLSAVGTSSTGGWMITLDNGARWQQVDSEYINRPKVGQSVTIRRAALGNYMAKVEKGRAFRVRRLPD